MAIEKSGEKSKFGYSTTVKKNEAYGACKDSGMPAIILVNPYLDQNVGSVSRAMLVSIQRPFPIYLSLFLDLLH
jgi:hypothetical protein